MARVRSESGWIGYGQYAPTGRNNGKDNPFVGTEYESLWENNPYADMYYQPTFWDYIGLSNKAKDANAEYERLYNEYVSGIYQQQQQDLYNSESAKVDRMKVAGLNPDLTGLSGSSESSGFTPPNAGMNPALTGQSPASGAFSTITQILGFATSTLQQIQIIKGLSSDNLGKDLGNFEKFISLAHPHIVNEYANRFAGGTPNDWSDISKLSSSSLGLSRRHSKKYQDAFSSLLSSSRYTASKSAYEHLSANDYAMKHFISGMVDFQIQAQKHGFNSQASKGQYESSYYHGLDASFASSATNRENQNRGWLDKWRNEFYSKLYEDFKRGSDLAGLMIIASGNPSFYGIFGAGINQLDRGVSKSVSNVWDFLKNEYKDWNFKW